jgi:hypothetical protein
VSGDRVVLLCPIQPGALIQHYSVTRYKENSLLAEAHRQVISTIDDSRYSTDKATFSLIIDPVNINDTSTHYRCDLFVDKGSRLHRQLTLSGPPVNVSLQVIGKYYPLVHTVIIKMYGKAYYITSGGGVFASRAPCCTRLLYF